MQKNANFFFKIFSKIFKIFKNCSLKCKKVDFKEN